MPDQEKQQKSMLQLQPDDSGFELTAFPLYQLNLASSQYQDEMNVAFHGSGIDPSEWRILAILNDRNPSVVGDLARRSLSKMPTLTKMLQRMETSGLITRRSNPSDGRSVEVWMTELAEAKLREGNIIASKVYLRAFDGISDEEKALITRLLLKVRRNLERSRYQD